MQRRPEFSFPGPQEEEEVRWLQASPDYHSSSSTPSPQTSREQVIAGYRREMLDLVRGLPETAYELSLRDIVEHHHRHPSSSSSPPSPPLAVTRSDADVAPVHASAATVEEQGRAKQVGRAVRRQRSRSVERSVSLDTGRLIKLFLPLSIHGRRKKKVSPKPHANNKERRKQDEEWWSKAEFSEEASAGTSTRTSSTGSNGSTGSAANGAGGRVAPVRTRSRKRNGCYAFFRAHKSKHGVSQD